MDPKLAIVLLVIIAAVLLTMGYFSVQRNKPLKSGPRASPHLPYEK